MFRVLICCLPLLLTATAGLADDAIPMEKPVSESLPTSAPTQNGQAEAVAPEEQGKPTPAADEANGKTDSGKAAPGKKATGSKAADAKVADAQTDGGAKLVSGMSILGNQEAPKSLVIVPWKSSQIGDMPAISRLLDDSTRAVDKEVFMRELAYYQIRSGAK